MTHRRSLKRLLRKPINDLENGVDITTKKAPTKLEESDNSSAKCNKHSEEFIKRIKNDYEVLKESDNSSAKCTKHSEEFIRRIKNNLEEDKIIATRGLSESERF